MKNLNIFYGGLYEKANINNFNFYIIIFHIYYAHCFSYKPTTAQSKIINAKTSSLNETHNAVDKTYGSTPRKTSLFKKFLAVTFALGSAALITFAAFKKNITNLWNSSVDNDNSPHFNPNTKDSSYTSVQNLLRFFFCA